MTERGRADESPRRRRFTSLSAPAALFAVVVGVAAGSCAKTEGDAQPGVPASDESTAQLQVGAPLPGTVALEVSRLRPRLREAQREYVETLHPASASRPLSADVVEELRGAISQHVENLVVNATSSDAHVAILRARVTHTRALLNEFERQAGRGPGAFTTEWNVLDASTLEALRKDAGDAAVELEKAMAGSPSVDLTVRRREVRDLVAALDEEIAERRASGPPTLREIDPEITVETARGRSPALVALMDDGFRHQLHLQAELRRLATGPDDPHLKLLLAAVDHRNEPPPASPLWTDEPRHPSPTDPESPRNRGPPAAELARIGHDELNALESGDLATLARSRARRTVHTRWLGAALGGELPASAAQAEKLRESVDCIVGMKTAVPDQAAIQFASSFYLGLAHGEPVGRAFRLGCNQIELAGVHGSDVPILLSRDGVDTAAVSL